MQKTTASRPKVANIAGPTNRSRPAQKSRPTQPLSALPSVSKNGVTVSRAPQKQAITTKVNFQKQAIAGANAKLSVDQILKQLHCASDGILNDVVACTGKGKGAPVPRSRSSGPFGRKSGDMMLESYNSVAFKHAQKRQSSASRDRKIMESASAKPKTNIPKNPPIIHHMRSCKCKTCQSKRTVSAKESPKQPSEQASVRSGSTNSSANAKSLKRPPLQKANSMPLIKSTGRTTKKPDHNATAPTDTLKVNDAKNDKKPFAFLQGLFKNNITSEPIAKSMDNTKASGGIQPPKVTEPELNGKATFEINRLSTIHEERRGSLQSDGTLQKESLTLIPCAKDDLSLLSFPFPRPRTSSTCCQSFQFAEVMTGWVPGQKVKPLNDFEPFAMLEAMDGANFINLKEDVSKSRQIIKNRLGIRNDSKPESVIQWKRGPILGRGAYGTVWCGLTMTGEMIAVKQAEISSIDLQKAGKEYEKIQQEIDLLKSLSHKNIVGYLGTSFESRVVSIFMQFVPGGSLSSILKKFGALAESVVANYTKQILEGVEYLHSKNVVHRDIKGGNIMLMPNAVIKLVDFGCAKKAINLTKSSEEILKSMKGTPYWMAPEVMNETGHGKKSDIWSIGCTVYEMATTKPPWSHLNPYAALFSIANGTAPIPQMPDRFSNEAKEFLCRDSNKRPDATTLLNSSFVLQHCQQNGKRILDSRGIPLNSTRRQ